MSHIFLKRVLVPDPGRAATYDSEIARCSDPESRWFIFECTSCNNEIKLDLPSYIGNYSDREKVLGPARSEAIRLHYSLPDNDSLASGWPKFRIEHCARCVTPYLIYIAVHEPNNGWYKIVPQGITQLTPDYAL